MSINDYNYLLGFLVVIITLILLFIVVMGICIEMKLEKITKELENKSTRKKKIDTNSLLIQKLLKNSNLNVSIYFPNSEDRITIHISKEFCITLPDKFRWEVTITSIRDEVLFKEVHPNIDESDMETILNRVYQLSNKYVILES